MGRHLTGKFFTSENLFVAGYLFIYVAILFWSDPEWLIWAGPITLGALPYMVPSVFPAFDPLEAFRLASYLVLAGLLALIFLVRVPRGAGMSGGSTATERGAKKGAPVAHAAPGHGKAA